ncbi:unnamed protein product [Caenorhabditis brenneri]
MNDIKKAEKRIRTHEERSKCLEQDAKLLAQCLEKAHIARMEREIRDLKSSFDNFSREQSREKLLKIDEHLKETLKERSVPTAKDYEAMTFFDHVLVNIDFDKQMSMITELDPSMSFEYVSVDEAENTKEDGKSCWNRLKEASAGMMKKIVKRKN